MPLGHENPDSIPEQRREEERGGVSTRRDEERGGRHGDTATERSRLLSASPRLPPGLSSRRYILPCHVLSCGGFYEYVLVSADQAREWCAAGPYVSFVTNHEWAWMLEQIMSPLHGWPLPHVPAATPLPVLDYADDCLVFIPEGGEAPAQRWDRDRRYSAWVVANDRYSMGLLKRLG